MEKWEAKTQEYMNEYSRLKQEGLVAVGFLGWLEQHGLLEEVLGKKSYRPNVGAVLGFSSDNIRLEGGN